MEYKSENKICQNCKKDFIVEPEDFNFYEKIKVPPPTFCPECRQRRRYAWRNERTLYRRNCDLCGKSKVSIFSSNKKYKVYCNDCWWGDGWEAKDFGVDFDFSRTFFEQFKELMQKVPRQGLMIKNSVNSDFTHHSINNKNCYYSFSITDSENVLYSTNVYNGMRDSSDCYYAMDGSNERHYECVDISKSYQCQYSFLLKNCSNCYYCFDMHNSSNCFLSANLRNKNYCILNKQYSREEYFEKLMEYNLGSYKVRKELYQQYLEFLNKEAIYKFAFIRQAPGCTGNYIANSKNSKAIFDGNDLENCMEMYVALDVKDSAECYHIGFKTDLAYEIHAITNSSNVHFSNLSYHNHDLEYCDSCHNSSNLFGCVSIKKGNYMILNKQYSKEEYKSLKNKIIEHMKNTGEYGEFFPYYLSPFGYNETQGQIYMPMPKDEAVANGFNWEDIGTGIFRKETILPNDLPDDISQITQQITKEILKCENCSKNYNIIPQEFIFYQKENIPIPRLCPDCRYKRRITLRSPRKTKKSTCTCEKMEHGHIGKCLNNFATSYIINAPQKLYCENCYNKEIY